jgi:protease IV
MEKLMKRILLLSLIIFKTNFGQENTTSVKTSQHANILSVTLDSDTSAIDLALALLTTEYEAVVVSVMCSGGPSILFHNLYEEIKKLTKNKPVIIYIETALSAGYYVACSGDYLICHTLGKVGSIGTVSRMLKPSEDSIIIQAGKYKICGGELTKEQIEMVQNNVNKNYLSFCQTVAKERSLNLDEKDIWADGKEFMADEALELGLIDEVGNWKNAYNKAISMLEDKGFRFENINVIFPSKTQQTESKDASF